MDLGKGNRETDMKIFEVSNKKIVERVLKDAKDKQHMKEMMRSMAQFIHAIQHPKPVPLSEMPAFVDVKSPINQKFMDHL